MKIIEIWKRWYSTRKAMTQIATKASEMENNEVVLETEISVEEYYEEELAMDESTENVEYQEPKEQAQVPKQLLVQKLSNK